MTDSNPADQAPTSGQWSDAKADAVGAVVVFVALVLAAVYFISSQV
ncbi:MAG: hypothetical protein HC809_16875 [Gammaproteobacteria bacterium]|nr:hypothetical protein [Gammaproteobacteria bacterium]